MILNKQNKGSILIWTVLLGLVLTSVFFFLSVRLGVLGSAQRDAMEYQSSKAYLDSYVAYLKQESIQIDAEVNGIYINLTQIVDEITGFVDSGDSKVYSITDVVNVEYNTCEGATAVETGVIITDPTGTSSSNYCNSSQEYDSRVTVDAGGTLTITSVGAPTHFRIRSTTATNTLTDTLWHLDADIDLGYG